MVEIVSLEILTDEDIEKISLRRMKEALGGRRVEPHGSTVPNHLETPIGHRCEVCDDGRRLEASVSVCLRCNRAARAIDAAIRKVKAEEKVLKAKAAVQRLDMIKAKAALQRLKKRRGAKLNPLNQATRKAIVDAVKAEFEPK